jgi:hypothetical protein
MSEASAHKATELLKLLLYKVTVINELLPLDWEARNWYWRWLQQSVVCGFHDLMFFPWMLHHRYAVRT